MNISPSEAISSFNAPGTGAFRRIQLHLPRSVHEVDCDCSHHEGPLQVLLVDLVRILRDAFPILTVGVPPRVVAAGLVPLMVLTPPLPPAKRRSSRNTNRLSSSSVAAPTASSDNMPLMIPW